MPTTPTQAAQLASVALAIADGDPDEAVNLPVGTLALLVGRTSSPVATAESVGAAMTRVAALTAARVERRRLRTEAS